MFRNPGKLLNEFLDSEKSGGIILILFTVISMLIANLPSGEAYQSLWQWSAAGHSLNHWINDGLMTFFFLLIGLELEREIYSGELSNLKNAGLPVVSALGGMLVPAGIFLLFNYGTATQSGTGIPMGTDIAFSIGILSLLGKRIPVSLKVLLTTLAVIDDLGAIIIIAAFYSGTIGFVNLAIALGIFILLLVLKRSGILSLIPYLLGGAAMWYFMHISGVHATISGVLLAFAIPYGTGDEKSPSYKLQHALHKPVAYFILPMFALANTAISIDAGWDTGNSSNLGIFLGLLVGKPAGIVLFSFLAVAAGLFSLPDNINWKQLAGAGFLAGIGFTMSIFITQLAYADAVLIVQSKISVLLASLAAGLTGLLLLGRFYPVKS